MAYIPPSASDLKAFYPAFAAVPDATVALYIARVDGGDVDQSWLERDYAPAIMAAAAHLMVKGNVLASDASAAGGMAAGVDRFTSADVTIQFNTDAVKNALSGEWSSTTYGQEYLRLLTRNKGGPRVTAPGTVPYCNAGYNGYAGPLGYPAALFPC